MKVIIFVLGVLAASVYAEEELETEKASTLNADEKVSKEKNYKKFVGEGHHSVPFLSMLTKPFTNGQTLHAVGFVGKDPKRINVNFQEGKEKNSDLPFHISARWDEGIFSGKLVFNNRKEGNWSGNEKRLKNPFEAEKEFDLRIRQLENLFEIYGNRAYLGSVEKPFSLDKVNYVGVNGDLKNLTLFHYGGKRFQMPFSAKAALKPGHRIDISGVPHGRFNVEFYTEEYSKVVLHLSFRFDEGVIVRNSMINGTWGIEEREGKLPISKGKVLDLTVVNEPYSFQIFLNGKRFGTYSHRISPDSIKNIKIDGNVDLHSTLIHEAVGI